LQSKILFLKKSNFIRAATIGGKQICFNQEDCSSDILRKEWRYPVFHKTKDSAALAKSTQKYVRLEI
jgi:hypothetical protein